MFTPTLVYNLWSQTHQLQIYRKQILTPTIIFLFVQGLIISAFVTNPVLWPNIFWFCNHISLVYAYAWYRENPELMMGVTCVGLIVQLLWLVDFITRLFGIHILHVVDYMFEGSFDYNKLVSLFLHAILPTYALYLISKKHVTKKAIVYSVLYSTALYVLTVLFSPNSKNMNCVFRPCAALIPEWHYTLLWPVYMLVVAAGTFFVTTHAIESLRYVRMRLVKIFLYRTKTT